jgi:hypothetical protein
MINVVPADHGLEGELTAVLLTTTVCAIASPCPVPLPTALVVKKIENFVPNRLGDTRPGVGDANLPPLSGVY